MLRHFSVLSGRVRTAFVVLVATIVLLVGFVGYLTFRINSLNVADETAALRESNLHIRNMLAQTDAILKDEARKWASVFAAKFPGRFAIGAATPTDTPRLTMDGQVLNGHFDEVDAFTRDSQGNVATVFVRRGDDFVRIATSLRKDDGSRATGTTLGQAHPAFPLVGAGQPYTGVASLFGRQYMTHYQPIQDAAGKIIGILFVGLDIMKSLDHVKRTVKSMRIGPTGYAYVLDARGEPSAGTMIIHPTLEGKGIADAKDGNGREFIREMLRQRNGTITYPWINRDRGETVARDKIVAFAEFPDWQWIIASGSYTDEIFSLAEEVKSTLVVSGLVVVFTLLLVLLYLLNRYVISPLIAVSRIEMVLSIRSRIVLYVAILVVVMIGGTVLLLDRFVEGRLFASIGTQQDLTTEHRAHMIGEDIAAMRNGLTVTAKRFPVELMDRHEAAQRWIDERVVLRTLFDDFFIVDGRGKLVAELTHAHDTRPPNRFEWPDRLAEAMNASAATVFDPAINLHLRAPTVHIAVPIRRNGGAPLGLFVGMISLHGTHAFLDAASSRLGESGHLALISSQNTYLAHPDRSAILQPVPAAERNSAFDGARRGVQGVRFGTDAQGRLGIVSYHPVPSTDWLLASFAPESDYIGAIVQVRRAIAGLALVSMAVLAWLIWYAVGRALAPLKRLGETMGRAQIAGFAHMTPVECQGRDELAALGRTFNAMAAAIEARTRDLAQSEQEMREIASALGFGIYALDRYGKLQFINPAGEQMLGWTIGELSGQDAHSMFHYQHADGTPYPAAECPMHQVLARGKSVHVLSDWLITRDGVRIPVEIFATPIFRNGAIHGAVAAFQDISVQLRNSERIRHQANHDALTGLANRRQAMDALAELVYRGRRYHEPFSLLMLDLDGFKKVNDRFGHPGGDDLLIQFSARMRKSLRQSDLLARLGGDEFAILLGNISADDAVMLADKLIANASAPYRIGDRDATIGVSIGVASYPETVDAVETLIMAADEALYLSKTSGKNRTTVAVPRSSAQTNGGPTPPLFLVIDHALLLGAPDIDQQHREMADRLNAIEVLLHDDTQHDEILVRFDALGEQFMAHLKREEQWLNEHAPRTHNRHQSNQRSIEAEIRLLRDELAGDNPFAALLKIRDWLVDHIRGDARLRPLITAQSEPA